VCRSCATTNIATLAAAGFAAAGLYVARIVRRIGLRA